MNAPTTGYVQLSDEWMMFLFSNGNVDWRAALRELGLA